ncbi:DMT family transporter [Streptomyces coeruleorubidus]|uniref:DMT family transporter n=1 Tax=Streptomyces coeruleorubidus TaxID=116188 RepID=UPI00237F8CD5|nr:DMT family transporter [Streptomyces coeruleorubidus]WDV56596.1 DMT family transporter [Streptomyces coeruleorubidus]
MQRGPSTRAVCAVVAAALFWSSSYAVTKRVLEDVGPLSIGAIRFTLAALLLYVLVRTNRHHRPARPDTRQRRQLYLSGFLGITVYFVLENVGVDLSTASDASLIVATYPLMTMLLELVVFRTRMPLPRVAGVLLATVGAFLVVRNGAQVGGGSRWLGDILLLLGGLAWAGYNVLGKRASTGQDAVGVTYYQTLAGAAGFLLASLLEAGDWRTPDATASSLLVYLAVACSVGGFLLYNYGLRRMASSVAVNILNRPGLRRHRSRRDQRGVDPAGSGSGWRHHHRRGGAGCDRARARSHGEAGCGRGGQPGGGIGTEGHARPADMSMWGRGRPHMLIVPF